MSARDHQTVKADSAFGLQVTHPPHTTGHTTGGSTMANIKAKIPGEHPAIAGNPACSTHGNMKLLVALALVSDVPHVYDSLARCRHNRAQDHAWNGALFCPNVA